MFYKILVSNRFFFVLFGTEAILFSSVWLWTGLFYLTSARCIKCLTIYDLTSTYFYSTRVIFDCVYFLSLIFDIFYTYIFMFTADFLLLFFLSYPFHFSFIFICFKNLIFRQKFNVFFYITLSFFRLWNLLYLFCIYNFFNCLIIYIYSSLIFNIFI